MRTVFNRISLASVVVILVLCVPVGAQDYIDFETLPDGTPTTDLMVIHDQYSNPSGVGYVGVTFFLSDDGVTPNGDYPMIAKVGTPITAFQGPDVTIPACGISPATWHDTPAPTHQDMVGCSFLTDDDTVGQGTAQLIVDYDTDVVSAGGRLLDIDATEVWEIRAYRDAALVQGPITLDASSPGTGDGLATEWVVTVAEGFDRLVFSGVNSPTSNFGLAFDNFYTSSIPPTLCDTITDAIFCEDFEEGTFDQWGVVLGDWQVDAESGNLTGHLTSPSPNHSRAVSLASVGDFVTISYRVKGRSDSDIAADMPFGFYSDSSAGLFYRVDQGTGVTPAEIAIYVVENEVATLLVLEPAVAVVNDQWYEAKIELTAGRIRAKRWAAGSAEPPEWQIEYLSADPFGGHLVIGGSDSHDSTEEYWYDDIVVRSVEPDSTDLALDFVDGGNGDTLCAGVPVTFNLRLANYQSEYIIGVSNGFRVYSPDGAQWTGTAGAIIDPFAALMDGGQFVALHGMTGNGADTVGFSAWTQDSAGAAPGFSEVVYQIEIGPIDPAYDGLTICLDSCFYPPGNNWQWELAPAPGTDYFPTWDGPHCFTIADFCDCDGDGIADEVDNCECDFNPLQEDTDADGVGDSCDLCEGFDDSLDADTDGIPDGCDNCYLTENSDQADSDGNCFGDECDCCSIRGDLDPNDGTGPDIADLVYLVNYMFNGGPPPTCDMPYYPEQPNHYYAEADIDGDGGDNPNISDLVWLVNFMFNGGPIPVPCDATGIWCPDQK